MRNEARSARNATCYRVTTKLLLLIVVLIAIMFVAESAAFHIIGRNGWMLAGPTPAHAPLDELWSERFGRMPTATDDGMVLVPLTPPSDTAIYWYRAEDAGAAGTIDGADGLIIYYLSGGPQIPFLPPIHYLHTVFFDYRVRWSSMVSGTAFISSDGQLWCRMTVQLPYLFRSREYVGSVDDFMPLPSAKGWRTARIHLFLLAHNVAIMLLLFGWPFFIGDARAAIRRRRVRREQKSNRLPRPTTLRAIGVRFIALVISAGALAYAIDAMVFPSVTADGPTMVLSTVTEDDEAWWKANMGELPPETTGPFHGPLAIQGGPGTWLIPRAGRGAPGMPGRDSQRSPESLLAYSIVPHPERSQHLPLRGRVLAGSDGHLACRIASPLPFVIRERVYMTTIGEEFVPNPVDERWQVRFRPLGYLANAAMYFLILGLPIYLRDARAALRIVRGRCTSCAYSLRGLPGPRCPECGAEIPRKQYACDGMTE